MAEEKTICGTVEKIIYQSSESWYSVCDVFTNTEELITVVGILPYISVGEEIEALGIWVQNKDYGRQFKVIEYKKILPKHKNSILRYLSSGAIKGIGPKIAKKIVDQYGEDSFDVIANHPEWLMQINGISRKKAYDISFDFKEKSDVRDLITESNGAISSDNAVKVYKKWGRNALGMLRENPYQLCTDHFGISFKKADEIAFSFGISLKNENRIRCGLKYVLRVYASRDGHTFVTKSKLIDSGAKLLSLEKADVLPYLENGNTLEGVTELFVENEVAYALNELYFAEINIAKRLKYINEHALRLNNTNIEYMIEDLELHDGIKYASLQKKAIYESLENGITILTGGPGTGKTTVIKALISIYSSFGMKSALCAPTGRAAKRMSEATLEEAKTIHRLLELEPGGEFSDKPRFLRNATNPIDADVIIVDESSMIDVPIMNALMNAVKVGTRLVFIGDTSQLPSVGEGNIFLDMIKSEKFSKVCLNEIFRQAENSGIVVNAHKINQGIYPDLKQRFDDFFFIEMTNDKIPEYITELCKTRLPKKYGNEAEEKIQVITPSKKGECGTLFLNQMLREALNPPSPQKRELKRGETRIFRENDRIMQLKNNYAVEWTDERNGIELDGSGVFNGEIGKIIYISDDEISFDFSGKSAKYPYMDIDQIDHSYAITVHKSQGSEYPIVIIPITSSFPPMLLTRNLIYTAITRAEKLVILLGEREAFFKMIDNDVQFKRNTMLVRLLEEE